VFSFFSGAGFLDLGFEKSGFEIAFANELNVEFVEGSCTLEQLDAQPSALD
jgi:DNA (cytosine-5)-methyltransferase 1